MFLPLSIVSQYCSSSKISHFAASIMYMSILLGYDNVSHFYQRRTKGRFQNLMNGSSRIQTSPYFFYCFIKMLIWIWFCYVKPLRAETLSVGGLSDSTWVTDAQRSEPQNMTLSPIILHWDHQVWSRCAKQMATPGVPFIFSINSRCPFKGWSNSSLYASVACVLFFSTENREASS